MPRSQIVWTSDVGQGRSESSVASSSFPQAEEARAGNNDGSMETIDWVQPMSSSTSGHNYADPASFNWYVFSIRDTGFKFADLSDHFAVTGRFTY